MIPFNTFLTVWVCAYLFAATVDTAIDMVHRAHLKKHEQEIPSEFEGLLDQERLFQMNRYSLDTLGLKLVEGLTVKILFLLLMLSGLLPWYANRVESFPFLLGGLAFFAFPAGASVALGLPFAYYRVFVLEAKFGFNTRTFKTWVLDLLKTGLLGVILGVTLVSLLLLMIRHAGALWWVCAWAVFLVLQMLILFIYPTLLAPLFNKFTPIEQGPLSDKIRRLLEQEGFAARGIFEMDARRRSRHTNAYVAGLGRTKRIVLFDTLMEAHGEDEILAILSHEVAHLKLGHMKKQLLLLGLGSFVLFWFASRLITWDLIYESFGFSGQLLYVGLFLIAVLWEPVGFFLSPVGAAISRRFEAQADFHALKLLEAPGPLITALKKMAVDNLSQLTPHPLYVIFHYSHPPFLKRIRALTGGRERVTQRAT